MAVDEALLAATSETSEPTLRFYQWQRPTISLGYFQPYIARDQHPASNHADIVRRLSGGGAIVHDDEITYSLALPAAHPFARNTQSLYDAIHQTLVRLLQDSLPANPNWVVEQCTEKNS